MLETAEREPACHPLPSRITVSPDVLHQKIDGHAVLLDLVGERYYSLDDVGTRIWELLEQHSDVSVVLDRLLELYEVDRPSLTQDLHLFFTNLAQAGLVRIDAGAHVD